MSWNLEFYSQEFSSPAENYTRSTDMNGTDLLSLFAAPFQSEQKSPSADKSHTTNKKSKTEATGPCAICEADKAGYHFGIIACPACSAFFRRTISENRKYVCRKTGHEHMNCPIDKRHRCYCRACRLQKCLNKGMDPAAVQPHRDSIGSKPKGVHFYEDSGNHSPVDTSCQLFVDTKVDIPLNNSSASSSFSTASLTENFVMPKTEITELDTLHQDSNHLLLDCHSVSSDSYSSISGYDHRHNLIEITVAEYRKLLERRRLFYCSSSVRDIVGGTHPEPRPAKYLDRVRRHHTRIEVVLFVEFLNSIHPFSQLVVDDKVVLLKHLSVSWSILEKYYCTMKGGGLQNNRIIHCDSTYTDLENPDAIEFDDKLVAGERLDKDTLNKLFITPLQDALREISGPMLHYQMTDVEFCGLTAILLFDPVAKGLSPTSQQIVKEARDRVSQDWFAYYRAHGIHDASERMGNTMLLLPAVQTTVEKTAENMRLIRFFELFEYDPLVDDLLP